MALVFVFVYAKDTSYQKALDFLWKKEYKTAKILFEKLAQKGDVRAIFRLANMYEFGLGVDVDYQKSHILYTKAAFKNHSVSQYIVAMHFFKGRGAIPSMEKTLYWLKRSAKLGNKKAAYNLGYFYEVGMGVKKNSYLAKKWYKKAGLD